MQTKVVFIRSRDGGEFSCYLALPETDDLIPAIVLASAVHGIDADLREIADEFAAHGFIAAAPDLFWRSIPGPLSRGDDRAIQRSQPRLEHIKVGERDMADTLTHLRTLSKFNGRAAAMGFCYGGPYAILGPKRLGYAAGISCHGTQMLDYIQELDGVSGPVCIMWGDQDHRAPIEVLEAYRDLPTHMKNVEVHVIPGVHHGYMMRGSPNAFHQVARDFSMAHALTVLDALKDNACRDHCVTAHPSDTCREDGSPLVAFGSQAAARGRRGFRPRCAISGKPQVTCWPSPVRARAEQKDWRPN